METDEGSRTMRAYRRITFDQHTEHEYLQIHTGTAQGRSVRDTRSYRGADIGNDHNLVITTMTLHLSGIVKNTNNVRR